MIRYEDADDDLVSIFIEVMEGRFPTLHQFNFKLVYDLKKRVKNGKIVLANIELANPKIKYFSQDDKVLDGYDYIIFVDQKAWSLASNKDKKRLISHELRHAFIDEKGNPKIVGHEVEDFYMEIKLNEDDPEWGAKLTRLVTDIYEQEKESNKSKQD